MSVFCKARTIVYKLKNFLYTVCQRRLNWIKRGEISLYQDVCMQPIVMTVLYCYNFIVI